MSIFELFKNSVDRDPEKLAINNFTYRDIFSHVEKRTYVPVCEQTDWTIILDILKAASLNKEIKILPKYKRENINLSTGAKKEFGLTLFSSGSSGERKEIFLPDHMLAANAIAAIECQGLTDSDNILTVCSLNHTGGINAQTLAGLIAGAHIVIEPFNPYNFYRLVEKHNITVSHLIPLMIDMLKKIKNAPKKFNLRLITAGSDCVYQHHVEYFSDLGVDFMINYGMTEAGPIVINHIFKPGSDLSIYDKGVPLGTTAWCKTRIINNELLLQGDNIFISDWLSTGDCVSMVDNWYIYNGRKSANCKIIPKSY
jgi:acyl-CoA synthetase (AMP-forming)/AMP-acid ligase II